MTNLTNNDDIYDGTPGDDIVNGRGGNDTISGNAGDDVINAGSGNDTVYGGADDDDLTGGSGDDTLDGGSGNDTFNGGSGNDTVVIHVNAQNGIALQNGLQLILTTADGTDTINSGVEHIQFDDITIDIDATTGDALAYVGTDLDTIGESGSTSGNVLDNDVDIDDTITITNIHSNGENTDGTFGVAFAGSFGMLTFNADGTYSYVADASTESLGVGESANDFFTYTIVSGGVEKTGTLHISITGSNDAPTIDSSVVTPTVTDTAADDSFSDATGTVTASDPDTIDTITFGVAFGDTLGGGDDTLGGYDSSVLGDYGTLYINSATGAYDYVVDDAKVEAAKTTDHDVFTFTISDGNGGTDSQTFDVTINGVNDTPELQPIAPGDVQDTSAHDFFFSDVTGTMVGSDRDNDPFTYRGINQVIDHSQSGFNRSIAGNYGTLYFNIDSGAYKYVANANAVEALKTDATDTFQMRLNDSTTYSAIQNLVINVHGVNDTPEVQGGTGGNLTEAGGVLNGTAGTDTSSLTVTLSDLDTGDTATFDGTALTNNGWSTSDAGVTYTKTGTYGTATLTTANGHVDYQLNDNDSDTQGLNSGDQVQDTFTVYATDGTAGNSTNIAFTIDGANDAAVVTGAITGDATEASGVANGTAGSNASGDANNTDVDDADDQWGVVSTPAASDNGYGTYTVDLTGNWTFVVNESDATVQALNSGDSTTDTFTLVTDDGTTQQVTVTIHGANDDAVVTGGTSDSVTEAGGPLFAGDAVANGDLLSTDVDNTTDAFQANSGTSDNGWGTFTVNAAGVWSYTLKNGLTAINSLNDGDQLQDTFTVLTEDGTAQVVTITINGHNEVFEGTANVDDIIAGSKWGDTMTGFSGSDIYIVNNAADVVVEAFNEGEDLVKATVSHTLEANVEDMTLTGHDAIDGTGNNLENVIVGNDARNTLSGMGDDDTLRGGNNNDILIGGDGDDIMNGGAGLDTVSYEGASGPVTVSLATTGFQNTGGAGFDKISNVERLTGSDHDDSLTGNSDKNVLTGGMGEDTLTGGAGNDTFVYHDASESFGSDADLITDLTNGDKIDLSDVDSLFHIVGSFSNSAHELVLTFDGTNTVIAGDIDGDGNADITILVSGDHHTYTNFVL